MGVSGAVDVAAVEAVLGYEFVDKALLDQGGADARLVPLGRRRERLRAARVPGRARASSATWWWRATCSTSTGRRCRPARSPASSTSTSTRRSSARAPPSCTASTASSATTCQAYAGQRIHGGDRSPAYPVHAQDPRRHRRVDLDHGRRRHRLRPRPRTSLAGRFFGGWLIR